MASPQISEFVNKPCQAKTCRRDTELIIPKLYADACQELDDNPIYCPPCRRYEGYEIPMDFCSECATSLPTNRWKPGGNMCETCEANSPDTSYMSKTLQSWLTTANNNEKAESQRATLLVQADPTHPFNALEHTALADARRLLEHKPDMLLLAIDTDNNNKTFVLTRTPYGLWSEDDGLIKKHISEASIKWFNGLEELINEESLRTAKAISSDTMRHIKRTLSPMGVRNAIEMTSGVLGEYIANRRKPAELTICRAMDLNMDRRYLGCDNGIVDKTTGKLINANTRDLLVSFTTHTKYVPDAHKADTDAARDCQSLVAHLSDDQKEWLESFIGQMMHGHPNGAGWLIGKGNSGKTTLLEAIKAALGDYAFSIYEGLFEQKRGASHQEGLGWFQGGRLLGIASDTLSGAYMNAGLFKGVTTGDSVSGRGIYAKAGRGRPVTASIMMAFNDESLPKIPLTDHAFLRRLRLLGYPALEKEARKGDEFRKSFSENQAHKEAVLAWLVECAVRYREAKPDTPSGLEKLDDMRRSAVGDEAFAWLTERVMRTGERSDVIHTVALYNAAKSDNGDIPFGMSQRELTIAFKNAFSAPPPEQIRANNMKGNGWRGFALLDNNAFYHCPDCGGRNPQAKDLDKGWAYCADPDCIRAQYENTPKLA